MGIFDFYQRWSGNKIIAGLKDRIAAINAREAEISRLADEEFPQRIKKIKDEINPPAGGGKNAADFLPEVFALVREAAKRTISQRHFDEQLMGGIVLFEGNIAEMKTGEGKTLAATLSLTLSALEGKGAHLVTVNDYLARRDASWMGPIYNFLGLSVGVIQQQGGAFIFDPFYGEEKMEEEGVVFVDVEHLRPATRQEVYDCDITYGTNNEFGFDYLRDNMARRKNEIVQRPLYYAIIDEVDSVLIDEARTPLIISAPAEEAEDLYVFFANLVKGLKENEDYTIDEKERGVGLTEAGMSRLEKQLGVKNLYDPLETKKYGGASMLHFLQEALQAKALYQRNKDYIVKEGQVIIVDEFTGRSMPDRRYSEGLHQAIEAKEGVKIKRESLTLATISFQNYFKLYQKVAGMTGTAQTEAEEFRKIYNLEVVSIPTHREMIRKDLADRVYKSEESKFQAVVSAIKERNLKGQPMLVGTLSVEKSERLSRMLKREGVKHEVLNAKHHEREAKIIAKAGQHGAVTIATNMAGRGVDIILGESIKDLGGLCVIGTERHESRRIDNQLRGRSGRQGDPGESIFFVSLEDDLMRIFGGDRIKNLMTMLKIPEDQPIESKMVSRGIESAQKKVEAYNFDLRKHLLEFDNVLNKQREKIYRERREILLARPQILEAKITDLLKEFLLSIAAFYSQDKKKALEELSQIFPEGEEILEEIKNKTNDEEVFNLSFEKARAILQERKNNFESSWFNLSRELYLSVIDSLWIEHLTVMDELRSSVSLRGYGQRDPLLEYKKESFRLFDDLKEILKDQISKVVLRIVPQEIEAETRARLMYQAPTEQQAAGTFGEFGSQDQTGSVNYQPATPSPARNAASAAGWHSDGGRGKIGRNELCPCGSGKKYKKCHLDKVPENSDVERLFYLYGNEPKEWEKETGLKIKKSKV